MSSCAGEKGCQEIKKLHPTLKAGSGQMQIGGKEA